MLLPNLFLPYLLPCRQPCIWRILRTHRWNRVFGKINVSLSLIPPDVPPGQGCRGETPGTIRRRHDAAPRLVQVWHTYIWYKSSIHSFLCCVLTTAYRRMQAPLAGSLRVTLSYGDMQWRQATRVQQSGPARPSFQRAAGQLFPGIKVPEREAYYSPPYIAEVKCL